MAMNPSASKIIILENHHGCGWRAFREPQTLIENLTTESWMFNFDTGIWLQQLERMRKYPRNERRRRRQRASTTCVGIKIFEVKETAYKTCLTSSRKISTAQKQSLKGKAPPSIPYQDQNSNRKHRAPSIASNPPKQQKWQPSQSTLTP